MIQIAHDVEGGVTYSITFWGGGSINWRHTVCVCCICRGMASVRSRQGIVSGHYHVLVLVYICRLSFPIFDSLTAGVYNSRARLLSTAAARVYTLSAAAVRKCLMHIHICIQHTHTRHNANFPRALPQNVYVSKYITHFDLL